MKKPARPVGGATMKTASNPRRSDLPDWRDDTLARMRTLILEADPKITEERKWKKPSNGMVGVPVWSRDGMICTGEIYKDKVKLSFPQADELDDPKGLFSPGQRSSRRVIDIPEGEQVDAKAFKALVKAAVARNTAKKR